MDSYRVLEPVHHDGVRYEPGETIRLSGAPARTLLEHGSIAGPVAEIRPSARVRAIKTGQP